MLEVFLETPFQVADAVKIPEPTGIKNDGRSRIEQGLVQEMPEGHEWIRFHHREKTGCSVR